MKIIQVDMFAVGLGSALLIQFALKNGTRVTVLADGGVAPGYSDDNVLRKLPEVLSDFGRSGVKRIDLIVGTHYDGDHLKGLIPLIEDESIEIGEVWLPPVKRDDQDIIGSLENDVFLAELFVDDENDESLREYLRNKVYQIEELKRLENEAFEIASENNRNARLPNYNVQVHPTDRIRGFQESFVEFQKEDLVSFLSFFESHQQDALSRTGFRPTHESAVYDSRHPDPFEIATEIQPDWHFWDSPTSRNWGRLFSNYSIRARVIPAALATIRESVASNAITAIYLKKVVEALRNRKPPIRPQCRFVIADRPSRFAWSQESHRFLRCEKGKQELVLTLLGPSNQLIERHRAKLPVEQYVFASIVRFGLIRREGITASNQLSYIFTLEMNGQRILVSGDSGCYGFRKGRKEFHKDLLRALAPLHVIQIAHHAGHNYDFYNALVQAKFPQQRNSAFLLVSHKKKDEFRPSSAFREFVDQLRRKRNEPRLLFTSVPLDSKIETFRELVHPATSNGADEGDIRLSYQNRRWIVEKHAIGINPTVVTAPEAFSIATKRRIKTLPRLKLKQVPIKP